MPRKRKRKRATATDAGAVTSHTTEVSRQLQLQQHWLHQQNNEQLQQHQRSQQQHKQRNQQHLHNQQHHHKHNQNNSQQQNHPLKRGGHGGGKPSKKRALLQHVLEHRNGNSSAAGEPSNKGAAHAAAAAAGGGGDDEPVPSKKKAMHHHQHEDGQGGGESTDSKDTNEHPFPYILQCDTTASSSSLILRWHSPAFLIPFEIETALIPILMYWNDKERRMVKDLPIWRLHAIQKACRDHDVALSMALSLRRHHVRNYHPSESMERLGLGTQQQVRISAHIFEQCVQAFLDQNRIPYWSEKDQGNHNAKNRKKIHDPSPPTPDFILKEPVLVQKFRHQLQHQSDDDEGRMEVVVEEKRICWLEAKMFYGASTIPFDNKSAVGSLMATAKKYVKWFGPGAMVFMLGCGDRLAEQLAKVGVMVLDCSSPGETVRLERVWEHQRTWCANGAGHILP